MIKTEILIIGGGLAGLTTAIHLLKLGLDVVLIEKQSYPHHKVCGEYISNEVLPYFEWLGIHIDELSPTSITDLQFTSRTGKSIHTKLPLGGFGLSRYTLDDFLYRIALKHGLNFFQDTVLDVNYTNDEFIAETSSGKSFMARYAIGAYGKRNALDVKLKRSFISKKSPYLAVKAHYKADFPQQVVSLNNFRGGYCGLSMAENNLLNVCYLANYESFKQYKSITAYQENVLYQNKNLRGILKKAEMIFEAPLTISQISFEKKEPVYNHLFMIGDTAGLIHPLCGNGMAMAIHSGKVLAELLYQQYRDKRLSRAELENTYTKNWKNLFNRRLQMGRMLSEVLENDTLEQFTMNAVIKMPIILRKMIKYTHGQPLSIPNS